MDDIETFIDIYYQIRDDLYVTDINEIIKEYEIISSDDEISDNYEDMEIIREDQLDGIEFDKNTYLFDTRIYIRESLKSYKYDLVEIWDQVKIDLPRSHVHINNREISGVPKLKRKLGFLSSYHYTEEKYVFNLLEIISMLTNQSSYVFPVIFLIKKYCHNPDLRVQNLTTNRKINITTHGIIGIVLHADFGIFDINENKTKFKIRCELKVNTNLIRENGVMKQKGVEIMDKYGVFTCYQVD